LLFVVDDVWTPAGIDLMDEHWDDSEESDTIDLDSVLSSVSTVFGFVCWCLGMETFSFRNFFFEKLKKFIETFEKYRLTTLLSIF
jgi:hypothetical protein